MYILKAILSFLIVGVAVYFNIMTYLSKLESMSPFIPVVNSIVLLVGFVLVFLRAFQGNNLMVFGLVAVYANL